MHITWKPLAVSFTIALIVCPLSHGELQIRGVPQVAGDDPFARATPQPRAEVELAEVPAAQQSPDTVEFSNGDKLHGTLMSIKPAEHGVRWRHASVAQPIEFNMQAIRKITLAAREAKPRAGNAASVRLSNEDLLTGDIVSLSDQNLILDTWYSGKIEVKRSMLRSISPGGGAGGIIYEGPTSLAGWEMPQAGAWSFKNGALYAQQSSHIGRNIDNLPDSVNFEFTMAWQSQPQFTFYFCSDEPKSTSCSAYSLRVSGSSVYLYRQSKRSGSSRLDRISVARFGQGRPGRATINLSVDKAKKTIVLLVDGVKMKEFVDGAGFAGEGNAILFYAQSTGGLKISKLRVTKWDGKVPTPAAAEIQTTEDMVMFSNEDKVSGRLTSIDAGQAEFATSYALLDVPLDRVVRITMSAEKMERARRNRGDMRALFKDSGAVTIELIDMEEGVVRGKSENFGDITLPLTAFRALEFNIYAETAANDADEFTF